MFRKNNMIHCTLKGYYVVGQHIATSLRYNAVKTCNDYGWLLKKYQKQYETHLLREEMTWSFCFKLSWFISEMRLGNFQSLQNYKEFSLSLPFQSIQQVKRKTTYSMSILLLTAKWPKLQLVTKVFQAPTMDQH